MKRLVLPVVVLAIGLPALAQDVARDWDLHREEAAASVLAYTTFDNGLSIAFRCNAGAFAAVIAGLPPARQPRLVLRIGLADADHAHDMGWTRTTDPTVAVADYPAALARAFREGGEVRVTVPGAAESGRDLSYVVDLPASGSAIDTILTDCNRPLVDPRDAELEAVGDSGLIAGFEWVRRPSPRFPNTRYASGFAVTTCMTQPDGSLSECVVESEHPHDGRFGEAAVRGAQRARVRVTDGAEGPVPRKKVGFYTGFRGG